MRDLTTSLPDSPVSCHPAALAAAMEQSDPQEIFHRLVSRPEDEATFLLARRVLAAFLTETAEAAAVGATAADLLAEAAHVRDDLAGRLAQLAGTAPAMRERAVPALLEGCWLDVLSQPALQPALIVNRLMEQHFVLRGRGVPERSIAGRRRRALEAQGVVLPDLDAADFLTLTGARELTVVTACYYLALSRVPASFLPEVAGTHCAFRALGVDETLFGEEPGPDPAPILTEYFEIAGRRGARDRARAAAAFRLVLRLESESVGMLADMAGWEAALPLDGKVARIIARHAPYAGAQHGQVTVGRRLLSEALADDDIRQVVWELRDSPYLKRRDGDGDGDFVKATKFGGPMFGIFDEEEAAVFKAWEEAIASGAAPDFDFEPCAAGDEAAAGWRERLAAAEVPDAVEADAGPLDQRVFFHRLVNVEHFPSVIEPAREQVRTVLDKAELLFDHGAGGRYTDAAFFEYTPEALLSRVEDIYWKKLVDPYAPLSEIPDRDAVIANQKRFALGSLIDGAWAHRSGALARFRRRSEAMLYAVYADEMGRGDLAKNHITLIHDVLRSMGVELPHIRTSEFMEQDQLPEFSYPFAIYQLSLSLFPDSRHAEILGYNLGIEMFGLGELRLHEKQKLQYHGLDFSYEEAHLSIDNLSAGHARQAAEAINVHLDRVRREFGAAAVAEQWRRVWRGYASFALFVEQPLVRRLLAGAA
ncbi:hypothetical protein E1287_15140 [Actinomadura sp. KC06]|uniref:iron-containing redox enzyme family protein n=1 Tax=Actinomadura sp. KC06 TaxID=2530369 RepID=UPI00104AA658|nr:iron-containing redox enzyme family protein [Actinomadura sp. KC06]TDD34957.1 hypothetical protein E1287_15140 [Actinomadura sp. KC06]